MCRKAVAKLLEHIQWGADAAGVSEGERTAAASREEKKEKGDFFQYLLHREFCELAPGIAGGKWDTVKPLGRYLADLNKCILFDDDEYVNVPFPTLSHLTHPLTHTRTHVSSRLETRDRMKDASK